MIDLHGRVVTGNIVMHRMDGMYSVASLPYRETRYRDGISQL